MCKGENLRRAAIIKSSINTYAIGRYKTSVRIMTFLPTLYMIGGSIVSNRL